MDIVGSLNRPGLAHRCREEQQLFRRGLQNDPRYCFELLRRALQDNDLDSWDLFREIFSKLMADWVILHNGFSSCGESIEYVVTQAFNRCLSALSGGSLDPSRGLSGILIYLKRCVHSEIVDLIRKQGPPTVQITDDIPGPPLPQTDPIAREKLWNHINYKLKNKKERVIVYATFFLCYHPTQIYEKYKPMFKNVEAVSRLKENIFARLRRDAGLKGYFDFDYDA